MSLPQAYLMTTKNLSALFNAIISAKAPERFTQKFLQQLEFSSSNDRLFIGVLKALQFIDESGVPTQRYYDFLDQTQSGVVLAEAIKDAYSDLFAINKRAHLMSIEEVTNKLKTLTQGQKSADVIRFMSNTFKGLCEYADFSAPVSENSVKEQKQEDETQNDVGYAESAQHQPTPKAAPRGAVSKGGVQPELHYNIQIILPETRDPQVYDAIFRSLKEHLY
ncbi:hypothetical protein GCM10023310_18560 [Paenibacillus vulneris]|uniref:DUF5343 domain-containing protein n=1 Tax=Paenibacillus vulneris TaxID=1133364 RepID=A0ABW3UMV3_9BACL